MANNNILFNAAISGAAGGIQQQRWLTDVNSGSYLDLRNAIVQFAATIDGFIPAGNYTQNDANLLSNLCNAALSNRNLTLANIGSSITGLAQSIVALFNSLQGQLLPVGSNTALLWYTTGGLAIGTGGAWIESGTFQATGQSSTAAQQIMVAPQALTVSNLKVQSSAAVAADSQVTIQVNGVPTALTATVLNGQTFAQNLVNTVALNRGDTFQLLGQSGSIPNRSNATVQLAF